MKKGVNIFKKNSSKVKNRVLTKKEAVIIIEKNFLKWLKKKKKKNSSDQLKNYQYLLKKDKSN